MELEKIKFIIWDMDDTFYERDRIQNSIAIPDDRKILISNLIDIGIQNTICSKNNYSDLKELLLSVGLWDLFVFPVINFNDKKDNIKLIIDSLHIQPKNFMFIDDNHFNREEVKYYIPELVVKDIDVIPIIMQEASMMKKNDTAHKIYNNYKLLEKHLFYKKRCTNNWDFLKQSQIRTYIYKDCVSELERIYELGQKTNQLNFTKRRLSKEALLKLFADQTFDTAYITVEDRYGDYGVVGFYSLKCGVLYDFYFSCRIMGMYIEQGLFARLGSPKLSISSAAAVVSLKDKWLPEWIDYSEIKSIKKYNRKKATEKILLRGECDMKQIINYIQNKNICGEFDRENIIDKGNHIYNMHTEILVQAMVGDKNKLHSIIETTINYDEETYNFDILRNHYDVILFGFSSDVRQGMYRNKFSEDIIIAGDNLYPINNKNKLFDTAQKSHIKFSTQQEYNEFIDTFEYVGGISKDRFLNNLNTIRKNISRKTKFVFIKYVPFRMENNMVDRSERISIINQALDEFCKYNENNSCVLDLGEIVKDISDFHSDNLHFKRIIYYCIATEFCKIISKLGFQHLDVQRYSLPFIPEARQIEIYKLFDITNFVLIGFYKESLVLCKALRKKCFLIVDIENRINTKEYENMKLINFDDFIKYENNSYLLIHKALKDNVKIKEYIDCKGCKEFINYEFFF